MPEPSVRRRLTASEAGGMTVNERLYLSGLLKAFDKAIEEKDEQKLRIILEQIYLTPENIDLIISNELD